MKITTFGRAEGIVSQATKGELLCPDVRSGQVISNTAAAGAAKLLQSCPTLCDPIDSSPPGSPFPRFLQARTLE